MSSNSGQWQKGESGNKKGRPPKSRVLAQALREIGGVDGYGDLSNQQLLAQTIWEGLVLGRVTFAGGKTLDVNGKEWLELVKWVHAQVDGNYRPEPEEPEQTPARPSWIYWDDPSEENAGDAKQDHEAE